MSASGGSENQEGHSQSAQDHIHLTFFHFGLSLVWSQRMNIDSSGLWRASSSLVSSPKSLVHMLWEHFVVGTTAQKRGPGGD